MNTTAKKNELIFGYSSGVLGEAKALLASMYLYLNSSASSQKKVTKNEPAVASTEEEDFEVEIDSLQFDLKTYASNVHRLGDIVGSSNEQDFEESRERDSSYTKRNIEQDFLNDAGSIKKS